MLDQEIEKVNNEIIEISQKIKQYPDVESCINALNKDVNNALSEMSLKLDPMGILSLSFNCTKIESNDVYYGEVFAKNNQSGNKLIVICNVNHCDIYNTKEVLKQVLDKISLYKVSIAKLIPMQRSIPSNIEMMSQEILTRLKSLEINYYTKKPDNATNAYLLFSYNLCKQLDELSFLLDPSGRVKIRSGIDVDVNKELDLNSIDICLYLSNGEDNYHANYTLTTLKGVNIYDIDSTLKNIFNEILVYKDKILFQLIDWEEGKNKFL